MLKVPRVRLRSYALNEWFPSSSIYQIDIIFFENEEQNLRRK